jgi:hypothetical protein
MSLEGLSNNNNRPSQILGAGGAKAPQKVSGDGPSVNTEKGVKNPRNAATGVIPGNSPQVGLAIIAMKEEGLTPRNFYAGESPKQEMPPNTLGIASPEEVRNPGAIMSLDNTAALLNLLDRADRGPSALYEALKIAALNDGVRIGTPEGTKDLVELFNRPE